MKFPDPICRLLRLEPGLINIFGPPGTGKTNICMLLAREFSRKGHQVFYMDTENGFSLERFKQIEPDQGVLERIKLVRPADFQEQGKLIRSLSNFRFVVIDSVVALYRLYYAERGDELVMEANRELSKQLSVLSRFSHEKGVPVIVTAHAYRKGDEWDAIGGEVLKYWSKVILLLEKTGRTGERKASLIKHPYLPEGKSVKFQIVQQGIKPAGFRIF
ncbi:MAG: hypothetical protein DRP12_03540 [Candidatus Aenigmatarchaeota archaeon]|nr:MAG: hypothetical protein DRP12_03540 [Candidatus Aenigmarchaeota archaeon]